ncbi:methylglyoxal synthase [Candidatus Chloroploca asiatica]|uniref:Methylglyoxal synthase n=1 Tax=Candidatus Chloroploca asiatica TaxID=1506545 RepID=A0A2H3KP98_9CHLR|nr:methylglyoxal synthase [Candidatus Chloroploca asiatica]PDW00013.1 methylglyoxal synthase [Candidatus Chloroploca asiatica]
MPTIALIAHDGKKADMVAFATYNRERLKTYNLVATASTGKLLSEKVGLPVRCMASGPYGGDAQIGALVVTGEVDAVIFLVDPLDKHPHDPDIQMLMRLCNVHNVPLATNVATADCLITVGDLLPVMGKPLSLLELSRS